MTSTLSTVLSGIGDVVTFLLGKFGDIIGLFTENPLLLLFVGIFVLGAIIGLVRRVISVA